MEIAKVGDGCLVRDAKDPDGAVLFLSAAEWIAFRSALKAGEFDI